MKTKKTGLIIFLIGAVYMIVMGWLASWWVSPTFRNLSQEQISETIWAMDSALFWLWTFSVPLGSILASVGMLLYVQARGLRIWLFGIGIFLILIFDGVFLRPAHYPALFGVGGGLILAFFLAILWFWAKKHAMLEGPAKSAAVFQLVSYVFFLIAMWFLCGTLSAPFLKALAGEPPSSPVSIIVYLVLGWLFLFLSHYKARQAIQ